MTPAAFDFRKPPPGVLERHVAGWLTLALRRASGTWTRLLPYATDLKVGAVDGVTASAGLAALAEEAIGFPITTSDAVDGTSLLAINRPILLALLAGLLGETPKSLPDDREPTDLEASLLDYLTRELVLSHLEKGWPVANPPRLTRGEPGTPRAVWRMPGGDSILLATLVISTPFGEYPIHLLVPRVGRWEQLARVEVRLNPVVPGAKEQIEALVREMPVDLAVVLGTADLTMHDLASLKAGDVVVLRQKVHQPLDGFVAGARKFRVWPGEVGGRAAILIEAPAED